MTPETAAHPFPLPEKEFPSTAGMTTKVVKGSIWTLLGQVLPLGISMVTTPFVIRILGAEGYGVLVLVALIPAYLNFADLAMGIASTKFASEAYAERDAAKEARTVHTAALIAIAASVPFGIAIFAASGWITELFNLPERFMLDASLALKFGSVTFVVNFLNNIFNTPQLTRLRMDLNTLVTTGFRAAGLVATPIVLYLGGGIAGAAAALLAASVLTLLCHLYVSGRLLPQLFEFKVLPSAARPMLKFGGALASAGIALVLLMNLEKLVLTRTTSVETLAYYSVAFTLAMMTTTLSASMTQSLVPAFSQLRSPGKSEQLNSLFSRSLRINILVMLPLLVVLFVFARPFFTIWAGEDFGRESTLPFYVLIAGLAFAVNNYVPVSLLMASGRTDVIAKLYWAELVPYIALITVLTLNFGAVGAAAAWALRALIDTLLGFWVSIKLLGVSHRFPWIRTKAVLLLITTLIPPLAISAFFRDLSYWPFLVLPLALTGYLVTVWNNFLMSEERLWLVNRLNILLNR